MAVSNAKIESLIVPHSQWIARKRIHVRGMVQGVGFRPFVYRLAQEIGLGGWVRNTADGVLIEVEGELYLLDRFLELLPAQAPPLAQIDAVTVETVEPVDVSAFVIGESQESVNQFAPVCPDVATCEDCYREFTDPRDRRYGYPFTNCTNCGPRYTIIRGIPYDRQKTTMADFQMCPACQQEFEAPAGRRFHAQPNACPACGPSLALVKSQPGTKRDAPGFAPGSQSPNLLSLLLDDPPALRAVGVESILVPA